MISLRGDVHKFYLKIKKGFQHDHSLNGMKELTEIKGIQQFYEQLESAQLKTIRYRMIKEQKGNGIIPLLVSSLPWLAFIFSKQLHSFVDKSAHLLFWFLIVYSFVITLSVTIHYREKAWAAVHIEIIEELLNSRQNNTE
ncbi:MAG TPA: hypothetical protein VFT51_11760 [Bacillales bacterium]|nr:hypothetical protein [Bacillales bacterium]